MFRLGLLFITVTSLELYILTLINSVVHLPGTLGLILFTGFLGAYLTRQQGFALLREISGKMNRGEMPTSELLDGACILVAGAFLFTPGLLTDVVGFLLLTPAFRALIKIWLQRRMESWIQQQQVVVMQSQVVDLHDFTAEPHRKESTVSQTDIIDI